MTKNGFPFQNLIWSIRIVTENLIHACFKEKNLGLIVVKTNRLLLFLIYDSTLTQPGIAGTAIETLADYFRGTTNSFSFKAKLSKIIFLKFIFPVFFFFWCIFVRSRILNFSVLESYYISMRLILVHFDFLLNFDVDFLYFFLK